MFEALRLSPRDPLAHMWFAIAGSAKASRTRLRSRRTDALVAELELLRRYSVS